MPDSVDSVVATFNIHHGRGLDGRVDLDRTARALQRTGADFVALQELDRGMARSGLVDQPRELGERTGLEVSFWPTLERDGEYGIAVAARGGCTATFELLPRAGREEPRGAIVARWRGITIVATHLSRDPHARSLQADELGRLASTVEAPVIVMGDLNQGRTDLGPLMSAGLAPSTARLRTLARPWSRAELDHVLAGRGARVASIRALRSAASDHRPVVARIEV